eukprot:7332596-Prymnesium_polylepis.1
MTNRKCKLSTLENRSWAISGSTSPGRAGATPGDRAGAAAAPDRRAPGMGAGGAGWSGDERSRDEKTTAPPRGARRLHPLSPARPPDRTARPPSRPMLPPRSARAALAVSPCAVRGAFYAPAGPATDAPRPQAQLSRDH